MCSKCLLCEEENVKLVKSHIIPKSLYGENLRNDKGPARILTNKEGVHAKKSPAGVYDQNIICADCEARFSDWDDYAHEFFIKTEPEPTFHLDGKPLAGKYEEVDVFRLRMFFISLLWRMGVTQQEMFSAINLGPYLEKLQAAILENNPDLVPEVDVVISKFDSELAEAFLGPTKLDIDNLNGYRIGFARYECWVKVDKRKFPAQLREIALSSETTLHVLNREFDGSPEKRAMMDTIKGHEKWKK